MLEMHHLHRHITIPEASKAAMRFSFLQISGLLFCFRDLQASVRLQFVVMHNHCRQELVPLSASHFMSLYEHTQQIK